METLYIGPSRLIHALIPRTRKRRFGIGVNSLGAALDARESMGGHAAGKLALDGMSGRSSDQLCACGPNQLHRASWPEKVAPFNNWALPVWLGTFNTKFGNVSRFAQVALPEDYRGSVAELTMNAIKSGKLPFDASKAIFEIAAAEGVDAGREAEQLLPLGCDMISRVGLLCDQCLHTLKVFEKVSGNVYINNLA
ncbi:Short-chain dehydrogenase/reductase SDR [Penicillium sp. IBT 18751x]|nr:Short-chain dehydrogenase/reductase SDR [Penicillium sp. IBT 18751x]